MVFKSLTLKQTNKKKNHQVIQAQAVIFFQSPKLGGHHSTPLEFGSRFHHVFIEVGLFGFGAKVGQPATRVG